ncbi:Pkinase-domain-containing protein [Suillus clintonianus]|uniref:Pkinase-domain-containing protein n=1 Tax=Suillus clintonianus TaxID=1904413 RepID=UPI001B860C18|nr:Pkinase-domain-containing protein [Suillus clintonianus]KAG2145123.1 Pkinase-domain-containing protein [Suillus clintonianus]
MSGDARRNRSHSDDESSSPIPSPGSGTQDRGRSRTRRPSNHLPEHNMRKRGYHSFMTSFGKMFHVEKRWKMVREMGSGAYGVVVSAVDEISGETVAIKLVTRIFEKVQLAKRALREVTLLRHFSSCSEPLTADLHQIIKSGQHLSNEHVQYFLYQILRGMKYVHSAAVIHRDLKPGNLLVNSDCELKICDFGLSRGFDSAPDEQVGHLTEYVATRWYRAPEIMLAFRGYTRAIDVWSIGCIFAELMLGRPLFKVDQLNKILDVLGTPEEDVINRIGSDKAQLYIRSLPIKKAVPLWKLLPTADVQALDLLQKMLSFDPSARISVPDALAHPWLASYHEETDEPDCPTTFEKWRDIEKLETLEDFRKALWEEIEDYRMEVRGITREPTVPNPHENACGETPGSPEQSLESRKSASVSRRMESPEAIRENVASDSLAPPAALDYFRPCTPEDPVVNYARRSSILQPQRQPSTSTYNSPPASTTQHPFVPMFEGLPTSASGIAFPSEGYVLPARSRAASTATAGGSEIAVRKLLRTLSTVSIHESVEGLPGGLAGVAPIGKFIVGQESEADAPPSEMPMEFSVRTRKEGGKELAI